MNKVEEKRGHAFFNVMNQLKYAGLNMNVVEDTRKSFLLVGFCNKPKISDLLLDHEETYVGLGHLAGADS
jgi:hypothetical protein